MNDDFKMNENEMPVDSTPQSEIPSEPAMAPMDPGFMGGGAMATTAVKTGAAALSKKLIALIVCLAIAVVGGVGALAIFNAPAMVANRALGNLADDFLARDEIDYLMSVFSQGSVDLSAKGDIEDVDMDTHVKFYFDAENESCMADDIRMEFAYDDVDVKLTASMYADREMLYIANDEILDGAYGLQRGSLESKLKNSIFNPDSDSEYALPQEAFDALLALCKFADGDLPEQLEEDLTKVAERYVDEFKGWLKKHAQFKAETQEVDLADGMTEARVVYIIITPETVCGIVEDFYEYIKDDDDLRDLIVDYYEELAEILEVTGQFDEDMDVGEMYDDAIEGLGEAVEEMTESIEDEDEDSFVAICMATPKMSAKLMKLWMIMGEDVKDIDDEDEVEEMFSIDFGSKGIKKTSQIVIDAADYKVKYTVDSETKGVTEYKLQVGDEFKFTLKLDEKEEKFKAQISMTEHDYWYDSTEVRTYAVEGKYTVDKDASTLELKKIKVDGEVIEDLGINVKVTFDKEDKMPAPEKKITSVLDIDKDMIEEIINNAEEWAEVLYEIQ